jgi:hypothetical protein
VCAPWVGRRPQTGVRVEGCRLFEARGEKERKRKGSDDGEGEEYEEEE